ncbi:penicillin amidase [Pilimelia terevasa]|uniref:Penicillin amidase n=1 Tax=Pilimelia terevasa TaxID=53372 RepID=A0A8J3BNY8_9ACTN|nr:penicillin acylase family protein [Pilimelia terevasa]GGK24764.1 penicillin amidase [Pilimelia terevasa]
MNTADLRSRPAAAPRAGGHRRRLAGAALALAVAAAVAVPPGAAATAGTAEQARWRAHAARVTITRDDWGVAHVSGATDADAVFGMMYAQAEDDFPRIENNYLVSLGRLAEAEGEGAIWQDLRQRLFVDPARLEALHRTCPPWLKKLTQAWADGLNHFLATHPQVRPRVLDRFAPWMALSFSEGSIGGDVERVPLSQVEAFYGRRPVPMTDEERGLLFSEPRGSNGMALAPAHTRDGRALLLINPHTSFFFRSEQHVTSGEGLNAYGAATWGQFFVYQGFNAHAGWMHTSSGADNVDEFAETVVTGADGSLSYRYGDALRPVTTRTVTLSHRTADGGRAKRSFRTFATHHGPIVREADGRWIAAALMNRPVAALQQSFLRTKAQDYAQFLAVARLRANSSNNTVFADSKGEIAFLMPQFMPVREDRFDYRRPVDGSDPATRWRGLHRLAELPQVVNPRNNWVYNTNNWPWTAAGADSPRAADYPRYLDQSGENPRGPQAVRVLRAAADFTPRKLTEAAFDPYLTAFARFGPGIAAAWAALPADDPRKSALAGPHALLRDWDHRWSAESAATSLAVFWGEAVWALVAPQAKEAGMSAWDYIAERATDAQRIAALATAAQRLTEDFGTWRVPWGQINRFQRNDGAIVQKFDDARPSTGVPFTSAQWGSLASFGARRYPGTTRYYGTSGNSFVAVVEFGPKVRARAVTAGGASGHPDSPHFTDQVGRYASGDLRPVYFHPEDLAGHVTRSYAPGQRP